LANEGFQEQKYEKSISYYETFLTQNKGTINPQIYTNLGYAYEAINQLEQALFYYKQTVEKLPEDSSAYFNVGFILN
jgi:tetratricopeptide (TPR) repeat protein